jgi:hypothetical protein
MGKPTNIASTSHAQAAEFAAIAGVASQTADVTGLKNALRDALARVELQDAELAAEKEAHAATQAALDAATKTAEA